MKITNNAGLPEAVVRAIENDPYDKGDADITATELIHPPQIRHLKRKHWDAIEEDAADRIWALMGQAVHGVIERGATKRSLQECRVYAEVHGVRIGGQFDDYDTEAGVLTDYKVTSVWKMVNGDFSDWENQLNVLAFLVRENGGSVRRLQIIALLRDWSKMQLKRSGNGYPTSQAKLIEIPMWSPDKAREYVLERVMAHTDDAVPNCTAEDRWARLDKWAVHKGDNKKALRVLDSYDEAEEWMVQYMTSMGEQGKEVECRIVHRPGENVRCESYCPVAQFCPQYAEMKEGENDV